jgi:pimeloyl-ACP methyl ester carboxylesterase
VIHGLDDKALLHGALDGTWKWIDNELTLVTIPGADHWVHRDKPKQVTRAIISWLDSHK